ncbi:hypothetical protein MTO96_048721 [Rhipicephalus appendiculatus]
MSEHVMIVRTCFQMKKETTLLGEDLDLGGGKEDKQTTTTTQKAYHNRHQDSTPERATCVDSDIHENPYNARNDHYYPCDHDDTGNYGTGNYEHPPRPHQRRRPPVSRRPPQRLQFQRRNQRLQAPWCARSPIRSARQRSAYPDDGVCDLLFFDSFYKDNKNVLVDASTYEPSAIFFASRAPSLRRTQCGISLAFTNTTSKTDFMTEEFYSALIGAVHFKIKHFGFLNLYREFSTPTAVRDALLVLKAFYLHINSPGSFYVLGLSIDFAENYTTVNLMRTIFVPSMFIAIGHISYSDASFPDCAILPPNIRWFPITHSSRFNKTYGHTLNDTLPILDMVRKSHPHLPLFISVGLSGRYYAPKLVEDAPDRYVAFQDCKNFSGPYYDDPANVCPSVAGADWELEDSTFYQYEALINQKLKRTFTFDNVRTLKAKVCDIKRNLLNVSFGVAAYDVDFDSNKRGCREVEIESGGFRRLYLIQLLTYFLIDNYTSYLDCLAIRH